MPERHPLPRKLVSRHVYVCRYCGEPDPGEWGTGRTCPDHPRKGEFPAYMQECEFCPVPIRDLFTEDQRKALVWCLGVGWRVLDEGYSFPRDQNREIIDGLREVLGLE